MRVITPALTFFVACLAATADLAAQIPVTDRPFNNGDDVFRFGIISDRTGGMRPGVFEDAVNKMEQLQPEFVMSVGDLIEGDTEDPAVWTAQWEEFEPIVENLSMPFYFVAGNHDITNAALLEVWKQRRGDPWYSFVYKDVLFLILHTEDIYGGGIGASQAAFARETLRRHEDVRWTLVFCHRPLWLHPGTGFEAVDTALGDRKYTVFAGHYHHYLKDASGDMRRYVLATSGGGSGLRGYVVGEFDHVTWVTMKPNGPEVVHLGLEGIIPDDIVNDRIYDRVEALRYGSWLSVGPALNDKPSFERMTMTLKLRNPTDAELQVRGELSPQGMVRFSPSVIAETVAAGGEKSIDVEMIAAEPVEIQSLVETGFAIRLEGGYELKEGLHFLTAKKAVPLDWVHTAPSARNRITIDGDLGEWPDDAFTPIANPPFVQESWDWRGPEDGRFRFAVQRQGQSIVVAVETFDDRVITNADSAALQDRLLVNFDSGSVSDHRDAIASTSEPATHVRPTANGLSGEFSFALPASEGTFRLNIGWVDHDQSANTQAPTLWWRNGAIESFGQFELGD